MSEVEVHQDGLLTTFHFPELAVRGAITQASAAWQAWVSHRAYPDTVQTLLGQAMAATPLMASTLKFEGRLSLQAEGDGAVPMLVVQSDHQLTMRGMAKWQGEIGGASSPSLFGQGRLGLIIEPAGEGPRYEGLVPLEGETLAGCLQTYFHQSEQLDTELQLAANGSAIGGLMLQKMPAEETTDEDAWPRLLALAETISEDELLNLPAEEILKRLFHEEVVELFPSRPVQIVCNCSHGRTSGLLLGMGEEEVRSILTEQEKVEMQCGFCGQRYVYGSAEIDQLFAAEQAEPPTDTRH